MYVFICVPAVFVMVAAPNSAGARMKMAKVVCDNSLATTAKTGWDGFVVKKI